MHHQPIPKLPKKGSRDVDQQVAEQTGRLMAVMDLPMEYPHHLEGRTVQVQPMYTKQGKPELDFITQSGRIRLTVPVVQALVQNLPRLYPNYSFFSRATGQIQRRNQKLWAPTSAIASTVGLENQTISF